MLSTADHDIARMLRTRLWATVFEGVYVDHTAPISWIQHAWAVVLFSWPAALCHESAVLVADGHAQRDAPQQPIHVAVARGRHLAVPDGVRLHRRGRLDEDVLWNLGPPGVRDEQAVIDVAARADSEWASLVALAAAIQSRRTTPARLVQALASRKRVPRRQWMAGVLSDLAEGTCSVLEHGYLSRVERPRAGIVTSTGISSRRWRVG